MSTLRIVFLVLAAALILFWLLFAVFGPRRLDRSSALAVLRYGTVFRTFALIVALTPPLILLYIVWTFHWRSDAMLAFAGGSFLVTSFLTGLLFFEAAGTQILLTEEGVTWFSPGRIGFTLPWREIDSIRYSSFNHWFVVAGAGRRMRVSRHLVGMHIFAETVQRKLAAERYASAAKELDHLK